MRVCLLALCITIFLMISCVGQEVSLGDVARETKARASSSAQHARVVTDADVVSTAPAASPGAQQFCDELRKRKDPGAEIACQALRVDMGPEYEGMMSRYFAISAAICAANHGQFPTIAPTTQPAASEWLELLDIHKRFNAIVEKEQKTQMDAEAPDIRFQQEEWSKLDKELPGWKAGNFASTASDYDKKRFLEINKEYEKKREALRGPEQN